MIRLLTFSFFLVSSSVFAQLPDGTIAPGFDLTDINGDDYDLYDDVLDNDIHVILDFSATWCGPCWSFHTSGTLESLYDDYGPSGSEELEIFMLEASSSTNEACLYGSAGCNSSTYGDWTDVDYPIFHLEGADLNISGDYEVAYFPTIYLLNGYDNRVWETGQASVQVFENLIFDSFELEVEDEAITDKDCQGLGAIDIDVVGGYNSLDFEWSNGETTEDILGLEEGDYYVTISDSYGYFIERGPYTVDLASGGMGDFEIDESISTEPTCNGAADAYLEVFVSGGVGSYDYQWSNGGTQAYIQNVTAGTYSVIVTDDLGCTDSEVFEIEEPDAMTQSIIAQDPDCSQTNGVVEITITGGTAPYTYFLNDIENTDGLFDNVAVGTYDIFVEDVNQCFVTGTVTLTSDVAPTAISNVSDVLTCNIEEVELSGEGSSTGSNFSYAWKDELGAVIATTLTTMIDQSGTYVLEVTDTDNDCVSSSVILVGSDFSAPTVTAQNATITCTQSEVTICGTASGASSYFWVVDGEAVNDLCVTVASPGDYSFTGVGANGCTATETSAVDVDTDIPDAMITAPNLLTCVNTIEVINASINGDVEDYSVSWSTTNGNITSIVSDLEIAVDAPGVYTLTVIDNISDCELISNVLVEEFINTPVAQLIADNDDDFLYLTDNSMGNPMMWSWSIDGVELSNAQDYQYPLTGAMTHEVCLEITNECESNEVCRTVSIVDPLEADLTTTNVDCNGLSTGTISIDPKGGVAPYTTEVVGPNGFTSEQFSLTGLSAGLYIIELNDSETRSIQITVEIIENEQITASANVVDLQCNGDASGEISLSLLGGDGSYNIEWSDGSTGTTNTNLEAGTITAIISDGLGCQITETYELSEPQAITQEGNVVDVACNGDATGSVNLSIGGGTGSLSFEWSNGSTELINANLTADTYVFTVIDENNCASVEEYTVSEPDALEYNLVQLINDIDGNGGSIDVTIEGGVSPYDYNWSNGEETEDLTNLTPGTYTLQVSDANSCLLTTEIFQIEMSSNVDEIVSLEAMSIYPNPASTILNMDLQFTQEEELSIRLVDLSGRVIIPAINFITRDLSYSMDLSNMSSGIYLLNISTPKGSIYQRVSIIK